MVILLPTGYYTLIPLTIVIIDIGGGDSDCVEFMLQPMSEPSPFLAWPDMFLEAVEVFVLLSSITL